MEDNDPVLYRQVFQSVGWQVWEALPYLKKRFGSVPLTYTLFFSMSKCPEQDTEPQVDLSGSGQLHDSSILSVCVCVCKWEAV